MFTKFKHDLPLTPNEIKHFQLTTLVHCSCNHIAHKNVNVSVMTSKYLIIPGFQIPVGSQSLWTAFPLTDRYYSHLKCTLLVKNWEMRRQEKVSWK